MSSVWTRLIRRIGESRNEGRQPDREQVQADEVVGGVKGRNVEEGVGVVQGRNAERSTYGVTSERSEPTTCDRQISRLCPVFLTQLGFWAFIF